jgi:hypothetical protein
MSLHDNRNPHREFASASDVKSVIVSRGFEQVGDDPDVFRTIYFANGHKLGKREIAFIRAIKGGGSIDLSIQYFTASIFRALRDGAKTCFEIAFRVKAQNHKEWAAT